MGGASGVYATWLTEQGLLLGPLYHLIDRAERVRALAEARRVTRDLATGTRPGTQNVPYGFTTSYFHRPEELATEFTDAGLTRTELLPVEGMAAWMPDIAERLADPDKRAVLLDLLERTEHEPAVLSATAHLLAVAHKSA